MAMVFGLMMVAVLISASAEGGQLPPSFDGPPAPVAPEVIVRNGARVTLRAVRVSTPLRIDGQLDEAVYSSVPAMSDFIQMDPREGDPATQKTEVWVLFDGNYFYVSARLWESEPDRIVANEMRRDNVTVWGGNDSFGFTIDPFYDRRNGAIFNVNAIGGRTEGQVTNERQYTADWNPVWEVKAGRFEGGWTVETAIPFKSLRYRAGVAQVWGFNARRINRWKNETTFLSPVPNSTGTRGLWQLSMAATLFGLEAPPSARNLEVKPYATSSVRSDAAAAQKVSSELDGDVGVDVKYGVTPSLTADFTVNTDFAQVEADEQQVNLTRFSLFFPEKREFFLENQGMFAFGGAGTNVGAGGDTPTLFYSRRVGLNQGQAVPIQAGGRLTGQVGRFQIGGMSIRTGEEPVSRARPTTFSVVRVKGDVLRRSSIGVIATARSVDQRGVGSNVAYGVDGAFAFFSNLFINTYWAQTRSEGLSGGESSYRGQVDYTGDRYGLQLERLFIGDAFNPEIGFVRRADMRRTFGQARFSPRPRSIPAIRRLVTLASVARVENAAGVLETRDYDGEFAIEFSNSDRFSLSYASTFEFLPRPFRIAPSVTLPLGSYDFGSARIAHVFGRQRKISGTVAVEHGAFYNGDKTAISFSQARMELPMRVTIEPAYSVNWVDLAQGSFTTHLLGSRVTHTMTPLMFVSALVQYNSSNAAMTANARLRWEYRPGSELFVVYNEQRDTLTRRFPDLMDRALIVKINRLMRF